MFLGVAGVAPVLRVGQIGLHPTHCCLAHYRMQTHALQCRISLSLSQDSLSLCVNSANGTQFGKKKTWANECHTGLAREVLPLNSASCGRRQTLQCRSTFTSLHRAQHSVACAVSERTPKRGPALSCTGAERALRAGPDRLLSSAAERPLLMRASCALLHQLQGLVQRLFHDLLVRHKGASAVEDARRGRDVVGRVLLLLRRAGG